MKNYTQGFVVQGIIAIIALVLIAGGAYFVSKKEAVAPNPTESGTTDPRWIGLQGEPGDSEYLTPLQTLEIAQEVALKDFNMNIAKECLDFDGIRENGFVTYNVSRKFGNGCAEKNPNADYPTIPKIKVDLKTAEAFSGTLDGGWKPFVTLKTHINNTYGFSFKYPSDFALIQDLTQQQKDSNITYMGACPIGRASSSLCYIGKETSDGFVTAALNIEASTTMTVQDCQKSKWVASDPENIPVAIKINDITFYKTRLGDAGLGHYISIDSYRTFHSGICYASDLTVESNRGKLEKGLDPKFSEYMQNKLQSILSTFKFLK